MKEPHRKHPLRDSREDRTSARFVPDTPQTRSPTYRLAFADEDFLTREELRPVRFQLELLKPQMALDEAEVASTVVLFGGARILPPSRKAEAKTEALAALSAQYEEARRFAKRVTERSMAETGGQEDVICTGGGPGVMEAGNRGAAEAGGRSIGLNIVLPHEQAPNAYVTPELAFNFHYFAIRKMHFLMRARAVCIFPGGFGTMDELFECLTLIQTGRMGQVPVLLFGRDFWERVINWEALAEAGTISPDDLTLFRYVETAEEALEAMDSWPNAGERRSIVPGRDTGTGQGAGAPPEA
ncbi:LOG family protein [Pseudoroseicyclus sp. CXY001]|uniref:LOG family protein n=1 Tax=Pseudoroseicyclus sp. CXY001 TaxID=3242492 RepID=UPI00358DBA61